MTHSIGETSWRLLRQVLRMPGGQATYRDLRSWGRKDALRVWELLQFQLLEPVGPVQDVLEMELRITERGKLAAEYGEIETSIDLYKEVAGRLRRFNQLGREQQAAELLAASGGKPATTDRRRKRAGVRA